MKGKPTALTQWRKWRTSRARRSRRNSSPHLSVKASACAGACRSPPRREDCNGLACRSRARRRSNTARLPESTATGTPKPFASELTTSAFGCASRAGEAYRRRPRRKARVVRRVAEDADGLCVVHKQPPAEVRASLKRSPERRGLAAAGTKTVGDDDGPRPPVRVLPEKLPQAFRVVMREAPHGRAARRRALDAPARDRVEALVHVNRRARAA